MTRTHPSVPVDNGGLLTTTEVRILWLRHEGRDHDAIAQALHRTPDDIASMERDAWTTIARATETFALLDRLGLHPEERRQDRERLRRRTT